MLRGRWQLQAPNRASSCAIDLLYEVLAVNPLQSSQAEMVVRDAIEEVGEVSVERRASQRADNRNHLRVCEVERQVTETGRDRADQPRHLGRRAARERLAELHGGLARDEAARIANQQREANPRTQVGRVHRVVGTGRTAEAQHRYAFEPSDRIVEVSIEVARNRGDRAQNYQRCDRQLERQCHKAKRAADSAEDRCRRDVHRAARFDHRVRDARNVFLAGVHRAFERFGCPSNRVQQSALHRALDA